MKISFSLDESDYLTLHLYIVSISDRVKRQRLKNRLIGPLLYLAIAIINFALNEINLAITFLLIIPLWYLLYPLWERRRYKNHYKRFVADTLKDRFGKMVSLEFTTEFFMANDATSESKIANIEIEGIDEIPSLFIIRLKGGQSLPIPKSQISDIGDLKTKLEDLADSVEVKYTEDLGWKWR